MVYLFCNRMTVIHGGADIPHPFSISLFEGQLFFTDWTKMAVLKANKFKETNPRLYYRSSLKPFGVTVYHGTRENQAGELTRSFVWDGTCLSN